MVMFLTNGIVQVTRIEYAYLHRSHFNHKSLSDQFSGSFQTDSGPTRRHGHRYDAQRDAENVYICQHRVHWPAVERSLATAIRTGEDQVFAGSSEEIEGRPAEINLIIIVKWNL